ncbi:LptF/LptG family permease [bacterium]|nr:LptF/LptG family permease [bacterium]
MIRPEISRAMDLNRSLPTLRGQWFQDNQWIINVDFVSPEREIRGLTVFELTSDNDLAGMLYAPQAHPIEGGWQLMSGRRIDFHNEIVNHSEFETLNWQPENFNAELLSLLAQRTRELTLPQVWRQVTFSQQQRHTDPELALTFWNRLWFPITYLGMLFLALVFSFGSFRQKTLGDAAFKGVATAIAAQLATETSASLLLVAGLSAVWAALLPPLIFLLCAIWLVSRRL